MNVEQYVKTADKDLTVTGFKPIPHHLMVR